MTAVCGLGLGVGLALDGSDSPPFPSAYAHFAAYLLGGIGLLRQATADLLAGRLGIDLLMVAAAVGAACLGDWREGLILLFLFNLSEAVETHAALRTRWAVESLLRLRPDSARRVRTGPNGAELEEAVPADSLVPGDCFRVAPGEAFAADGQVVAGGSWADESSLTGEALPVAKTVGSSVFAGCRNGTDAAGSLLVRTLRPSGGSLLAKIVDVARRARERRLPVQQTIERWQSLYAGGVLATAGLVSLLAVTVGGLTPEQALYRATVVLVAGSPCAVVLACPSAMLAVMARAGGLGVLFKGADALERLATATVFAFDKTGTLTQGKPVVAAVSAEIGETDRLLALAAAVERHSEHPLAAAVVAEARRRGLDIPAAEGFLSRAGVGVQAQVDGLTVQVGRPSSAQSPTAASSPHDRLGGTLVAVSVSDGSRGTIELRDQLRPMAKRAVAALRVCSPTAQIAVLSGDNAAAVSMVAEAVAANLWRAGLRPDGKVAELEALRSAGHRVAMIGDGVNDAPALSAADVGVAMGAAGSDAALQSADVVLMADDLLALPRAVGLARAAHRRAELNLLIAGGSVLLLLVATQLGLSLWLAVIGHEGTTALVALNGLRLLWHRPSNLPAEPASG